jgi:hypothetical protein
MGHRRELFEPRRDNADRRARWLRPGLALVMTGEILRAVFEPYPPVDFESRSDGSDIIAALGATRAGAPQGLPSTRSVCDSLPLWQFLRCRTRFSFN